MGKLLLDSGAHEVSDLQRSLIFAFRKAFKFSHHPDFGILGRPGMTAAESQFILF
jgi:hypothetical protein